MAGGTADRDLVGRSVHADEHIEHDHTFFTTTPRRERIGRRWVAGIRDRPPRTLPLSTPETPTAARAESSQRRRIAPAAAQGR
jgi:hypothetical protein